MSPAPRSRLPALIDWSLIAIALAVLVALPKPLSSDALYRYQALQHFMDTGALTNSKYSFVGPLASSPLFLLGRALGHERGATLLFNALLFLIALFAVWRDFRDALSASARRNLLFSMVFASMFPHHVERYYSEVFTTVMILVGLLAWSKRRELVGSVLIVLGALNTPAALLGVAGIAFGCARRIRKWWPLGLPVIVFALTRLEARLVRGAWFATGYEQDAGFHTVLPYSGLPGFSYPFFFGVLGIFLSFGKGLLFFAPGMFLPLPSNAPERLRWVKNMLLVFVGGLVLVYARWWAWHGAWFWGPRFFLAASLPACISLFANLECPPRSFSLRALLAVVLTLSFWVGVNGLAFQSSGLELCAQDNYRYEFVCHFVPEMSVLWHPFVDGAASHPPLLRKLAFVAVGFWAVALGWLGRGLFASLGRDLPAFLRQLWRAVV